MPCWTWRLSAQQHMSTLRKANRQSACCLCHGLCVHITAVVATTWCPNTGRGAEVSRGIAFWKGKAGKAYRHAMTWFLQLSYLSCQNWLILGFSDWLWVGWLVGGLVDGTTGWRMDVIGGLVDSMVDLPQQNKSQSSMRTAFPCIPAFPRSSPEATHFVEKYEK